MRLATSTTSWPDQRVVCGLPAPDPRTTTPPGRTAAPPRKVRRARTGRSAGASRRLSGDPERPISLTRSQLVLVPAGRTPGDTTPKGTIRMLKKFLLALVATLAIAAPLTAAAAPAQATPFSQQQAVGAANDYLRVMPFSRQGLIDQLSSPYGSGFSSGRRHLRGQPHPGELVRAGRQVREVLPADHALQPCGPDPPAGVAVRRSSSPTPRPSTASTTSDSEPPPLPTAGRVTGKGDAAQIGVQCSSEEPLAWERAESRSRSAAWVAVSAGAWWRLQGSGSGSRVTLRIPGTGLSLRRTLGRRR